MVTTQSLSCQVSGNNLVSGESRAGSPCLFPPRVGTDSLVVKEEAKKLAGDKEIEVMGSYLRATPNMIENREEEDPPKPGSGNERMKISVSSQSKGYRSDAKFEVLSKGVDQSSPGVSQLTFGFYQNPQKVVVLLSFPL